MVQIVIDMVEHRRKDWVSFTLSHSQVSVDEPIFVSHGQIPDNITSFDPDVVFFMFVVCLGQIYAPT